jgi:hypothetical protein
MTRRYEIALDAYTTAERDLDRAKARNRAAKLLAVRLEPLHRHSPWSFDLSGRRTDERKSKRIEAWLDVDQAQDFPLQEPSWEARSAEGWSKQADGSHRRKIDELEEFCGRVGEWGSDGEGIR